jgi:hypothetical protein
MSTGIKRKISGWNMAFGWGRVRMRFPGETLMKQKSLVIIAACILLLTILLVPAVYGQEKSYAISGTLVTPRGIVDEGIVLISNGSIQGIGSKIPLPPGTALIKTDGVVFPGLIDLHNHLVWNVFPRWTPPSPVGIGTIGKR